MRATGLPCLCRNRSAKPIHAVRGSSASRARTLVCALLFGALSTSALADNPVDFELSSGQRTFRLSEARGRFVALHFLLKTECPLCLKHTADYVRLAPSVAGVEHVFIKPDAPPEIESWRGKLPEGARGVDIYHDEGARLANAFGVPDGYAFHGQTVHYPALILLDPQGREVFRHVGRNNADRLPFDAFAAKVAALSSGPEAVHGNLANGGLALRGFDPVSYFDGAEPRKGDPALSSAYRGATYHFASAENRARFAARPEKYVPQYGGWCATAMAEGGRKVDIDPASYKVTGGRLFLFYKGWLGDARAEWVKDEASLTKQADEAWSALVAGR